MRHENAVGWLLTLPAVLMLGVVGIVPLLAVFNYSFFDIFILQNRYWIGLEWYQGLVGSAEIYRALGRSLLFMIIVLLVQFPLGVGIALLLPRGTAISTLFLMLLAVPLVVPWNMIPIIWLNLVGSEYGRVGQLLAQMNWVFDYKFNAVHTWMLIVVMDTWHWVGLVTILAYSGLSAIPSAYLQAAAIDGASAWQTFRYIQLPKMKGVLIMALLLRTMDSLMIYTEAFAINAGGPDGATTFLSLQLGEEIAAYDYGPAAARSVVYFLLVLLVAWLFQLSLKKTNSQQVKG